MTVIKKSMSGVTVRTRARTGETVAIPWKARDEASKRTAGFSASFQVKAQY